MNKICFGCGAKLQCDNKEEIGFIPKEKIDNSTYCQRCFRIIHYGEEKSVLTPKSINSIINNINKEAKFVLFVTDFISLNEDLVKVFKKIKKDKILLINKNDIIPKSVIYEHLINKISKVYQIKDEIKIIGSNTGYNINALINYLDYRNIREVYILGETNAGKSSLINKMIDILDTNVNKVTTSKLENTTLDFIRLKLSNNLTVIDSPGFIINETHEKTNTLINPKVYQIKKEEILKINNDYFKFSESTSVIVYMNSLYKCQKYYKDCPLNEKYLINANSDLVIKGDYLLNIKNKCVVETNISKDQIEVRDSILGGLNE